MFNPAEIHPTVLVIEDEATQRNLLRGKLQSLGFQVITAENGQTGLEIWAENMRAIRIVISDLEMPLADGFDVIKTIRTQEELYTYIMIQTTVDDKNSLINALRYGADDFITKPIITEELELRLQGALRLLRLQDQYELVGALAELASERGGETGTHLKRTKEYCRIMAEDLRQHHPEFNITEHLIEDIANISVLHDIGKNGIPDGLLNKKGRYTPKEYEIVKDHTLIGGNILMKLHQQTASPFLLLGHEIAVAHHEKWDGSGYPLGLKGEKIPLAARIVAFIDVYDALLSKRPYKDPLSLSHAEVYIKAEKGKHFDPDIVESYERVREQFIAIHNSIQETETDW